MGAGPRRGERAGAQAPRASGRLRPTDSGERGSGRLRRSTYAGAGGRERPARPAVNARAAAGRPASPSEPRVGDGAGREPKFEDGFPPHSAVAVPLPGPRRRASGPVEAPEDPSAVV